MRRENRAILDGAIAVARGADAHVLVLTSAIPEETAYLRERIGDGIRIVGAAAPSAGPGAAGDVEEDDVIALPPVRLRRRGRAKVALLEGLASGLIRPGERVVVVSGDGEAAGPHLDTIALIGMAADDGLLAGTPGEAVTSLAHVADPAVFDAVLGLCLALGRQGRDGRPVGFLAVLGDHEAVLARSHPLVLNPFEGHAPEARHILQPAARRAVREFSGVDGAFVITGDGLVVAAGRYLEEPAGRALPAGLGARHRAAAGITGVTRSVAFVVSESSGEVRIFSNGRVLMTFSPED